MPDKWPLANGNWSNAANWNGGTKPVAGDDVYADGKTVTIDEDFTVASVRVTQRSGGTLGGTFNISSNRILTANGLGFTAASGATPVCLNVLSGCSTLTLNGNVTAGGNSGHSINITNTCTININGNVISGNGAGWVQVAASSVIMNIVGNLVGNSGAATTINLASPLCQITITGNITANLQNTGLVTFNSINNVLNVTGNVSGNTQYAIISSQSGNVVNITGIANPNAVWANAGTLTVTCVGQCIASSTLHSIANTTGGTTTISATFTNSSGRMAVYAPLILLYGAPVQQWTFQNESNTSKILYSAGVALGNPATNNVRSGTVYGASNELTGTLTMAVPANVRRGVPTDATVGTADLTAQDIFTAISTSSDPIAVRLRNIATVQTTGAQLASYT